MEQSIQPLNVAAATLLIQLLLITLLAITSSLYDPQRVPSSGISSPMHDEIGRPYHLPKSPTLFIALITFATLLISDELYSIWSPIFKGVGINTISATTSIATVFILDLFLTCYLVGATGGSRNSPFLPFLFTIPAIAIFLRLPPSLFISFTIITILIYLLLLAEGFNRRPSRLSASAFANIACLILSIFTGYITRPVPINELSGIRERITDSGKFLASGAHYR